MTVMAVALTALAAKGSTGWQRVEGMTPGETIRVEGPAIGEDGIRLSHAVERLRAFQRGHAGERHLWEFGREPRRIGLRIGADDQDIGRHAYTFMRSPRCGAPGRTI